MVAFPGSLISISSTNDEVDLFICLPSIWIILFYEFSVFSPLIFRSFKKSTQQHLQKKTSFPLLRSVTVSMKYPCVFKSGSGSSILFH